MLQDDFNKLLKYFETANPQKIDLAAAMTDSLAFFEKLKKELIEANPEKRAEMVNEIQELYKTLQETMKQFAEKSGVTAEQLIELAETKENFTPEQWETLETARRQMGKMASQVYREIAKPDEGQKGKKPKGPTKPSPRTEWKKS